MGTYNFDDNIHEDRQLPAGQRGIGCIMIILLPIVSYVAAIELLKVTAIRNSLYRISPTLFGTPDIPQFLWGITAIGPFLQEVYSWTNLEANILLGLVILLFLSGVIAVIYSIMYRAVAPSRYRKTDAPPASRKTKKYKR